MTEQMTPGSQGSQSTYRSAYSRSEGAPSAAQAPEDQSPYSSEGSPEGPGVPVAATASSAPPTSSPFIVSSPAPEPTPEGNGPDLLYGTAPAAAPAAAIAAPGPKAKGSKGWIVAIAIVAILAITLMFTVASCNSMVSDLFDPFDSLYEEEGVPSSHGSAIALINIDGAIDYDGSASSPEGLSGLLASAEEDDSIEGVILRVNSGGGSATAGEEMARYVRDFSKPIVVSSAAINASAAYEISSQADYIFTAKTTSIGAIGVLMQVTDLSGLYDKLGISVDSITSSESKDSSSGVRPLTEEERQWYQRMVDQIDAEFVSVVAEGREMPLEEVRKLANGMPYTGIDAVTNGLADEIGSLEDALEYISCTELGYSKPLELVDYTYSSSSLRSLLDLLGETKTSDDAALDALVEKFGKLEDAHEIQ